MVSLVSAAKRGVHSLTAPGMFTLMLLSVLLTVALLIFFVVGTTGLLSSLTHSLHLSEYVPWLGGIVAGLIAWFLFPGIMPVIVSFFDNRIATLIEQDDYPAYIAAHKPAFLPEFLHDLGFTIKAVLLNVLVLPIYIFFPLVNIAVFYALNGYLLGREFFVMVARRHMPVSQAEALRKKNSRAVTLGGIALTLCATIPFINLVAPFWGIALMTHLFHQMMGHAPGSRIIEPKQLPVSNA